MVWNISFQIAGLILTLIIIYFSYSQRRLQFRAEKAFYAVLLNVVVCNTLDVLAIIAMNYQSVIGRFATELICEALLVSLASVACHSAWFSVAEIRAVYPKQAKMATVLPVAVSLLSCVFFETKFYVNHETNEIFFYGLPDFLTFTMCMVYVVSGFIMIVRRRRSIKLNRRIIIYSWLAIWSVAGILQRFMPWIPIVGFSISLACLFMYCKLENPDYNIDASNGIFNQKAFHTKVEELISEKKSNAIVSFAVTNMSVIKEIFGSTVLNSLLKDISIFAQSFDDTTGFRLEDNVFSIIVEKREDMDLILDKISDRFDDHWVINNMQINVNVTISYIEDISIFTDRESLEEAIHFFAIEGLKRTGDIISISIEEVENRKRTIETQHALDWAFANNGVVVYYQPIYNIEKGRFTAMEALVRIKDENGKLLFPDSFIEYAEKNGMILKLGEEIFRSVCDFIRRSKIEQYGIEFIDVNLSVVQCMQEDLARTFKNILGEYQVPPYRVNLEITETAAVASKKSLDKNMQELIDYGVSFSLDDYGSGYSNLTYIVGLPVSIIKIDREITISYRKSEKARIATDSTINMIHNLGMEIIVEGVETEEQYLDFKNLGVNLIQGYYFSKPLSREAIIPFIQGWL